MSWHFGSLKLQCEGLGRKNCSASLTIENPDGVPGSLLMGNAESKGWWVGTSGSTLCPQHVAEAEKKYAAKLLKENPPPAPEPPSVEI